MTRKLKLAECEARDFRNALGTFATGVTIITTRGLVPGEYVGITANSFSSVSLDPPLILFSLGKQTYSLGAFQANKHFAVNVLSRHQIELSHRFARSSTNKWQGMEFELWDFDCPIFPGCVASFECWIHHTYDGGDHVIFVGRVEHMAIDPAAEPLLFLKGRYGHFQAGE